MLVRIEREIPGRLRLRLAGRVPEQDHDALLSIVESCPGVNKVCVYPRIGALSIAYDPHEDVREQILSHVCSITLSDIERARGEYAVHLAPRTHALLMDIVSLVSYHFLRRWLFPRPLAFIYTLWQYRKFLLAAFRSLARAKLDVPVLDAAAIGVSFLKRDPRTAASTIFLLNLGETLEEYTRARSENELIYSLLAVPESAQLIEGSEEITVACDQLNEGDLVVIRTGMPICIDGVVEKGLATVNQSALTGEPLAIERSVHDTVYAGTAVEDGEIYVRVSSSTGDTKLRSIVSMVENSGSLKAEIQSRRERLADTIVPYNFLLAGIVALSTRSLIKTSAALMVDYSCALKLTSSIAVLSAMSQSVACGFTVKGSKHFEAFADADTIVFDKTGTLTNAEPQVGFVLAFDGWNKTSVLRLAACLEEHFPHPVARAVVREAAHKRLKHRERHAEVEYIVAHGIASSLDGKRVVIGSRHFVVEDEGVTVTEDQLSQVEKTAQGMSVLFLAVDGELVGVIGIDDPLKDGVIQAVSELRRLGFKRVIMLTGDNSRTAAMIAETAGITEFKANCLPEQKHEYVEHLKTQGCRVVMVGDGVNDSPALSAADVGVAMAAGTAIAKEVADITLSDGDLMSLVSLRKLSLELMNRMSASFKRVIGFNSALLALGIGGAITPQFSSFLHNGSTIIFSVASAKDYKL